MKRSEFQDLVSLSKTFLILAISIGTSQTLFGSTPDNWFGFAFLLTGLFGYYCFDRFGGVGK